MLSDGKWMSIIRQRVTVFNQSFKWLLYLQSAFRLLGYQIVWNLISVVLFVCKTFHEFHSRVHGLYSKNDVKSNEVHYDNNDIHLRHNLFQANRRRRADYTNTHYFVLLNSNVVITHIFHRRRSQVLIIDQIALLLCMTQYDTLSWTTATETW